MKKIAISQSNYIPWKGYFDLINKVDEFILYDDAQFTRRDWRNRNKIKTPNGLQWLTIPVDVKGKYFQKIKETKISDKNWGMKHWQQIKQNYSKARHFKNYKDIFEKLYLNCNEEYLSEINYKFIITINQILGIKTKIRSSDEFEIYGNLTEKLLNICKQCKANIYISGPAAKNYFDEKLAEKENIQVQWMNYSNYDEYEQLFPPFEHGVSILDLIFNIDQIDYIKKNFKND
jgi:hypothetical protein